MVTPKTAPVTEPQETSDRAIVAEPARDSGAAPTPKPAISKLPRQPPVSVAAAPGPAPRVLPKVATAPAVPQPSPAPLDFKSLETRLRQTQAIGVFTKLALKNQVDDLLGRFRAYHKRQGTATLAELRRNYDLLLLKVLSLLQDTDPPLARDIVKSRAAMWNILEDPKKFSEFNLKAGAT